MKCWHLLKPGFEFLTGTLFYFEYCLSSVLPGCINHKMVVTLHRYFDKNNPVVKNWRQANCSKTKKAPDETARSLDFSMVGTAGFEPATTCPPDKCATRLRYAPNQNRLGKYHFRTTVSSRNLINSDFKQMCRLPPDTFNHLETQISVIV